MKDSGEKGRQILQDCDKNVTTGRTVPFLHAVSTTPGHEEVSIMDTRTARRFLVVRFPLPQGEGEGVFRAG